MGAGEHALKLGRLDPLPQAFVHFVNICQGGLVPGLLPQLDHDPHILKLPDQRIPHLHDLFQGGAPFQDFLGFAGIVPETVRGDLGLDLLDRFTLVIYVKETPEAWRCALRDRS
jgi:hypothetical protein